MEWFSVSFQEDRETTIKNRWELLIATQISSYGRHCWLFLQQTFPTSFFLSNPTYPKTWKLPDIHFSRFPVTRSWSWNLGHLRRRLLGKILFPDGKGWVKRNSSLCPALYMTGWGYDAWSCGSHFVIWGDKWKFKKQYSEDGGEWQKDLQFLMTCLKSWINQPTTRLLVRHSHYLNHMQFVNLLFAAKKNLISHWEGICFLEISISAESSILYNALLKGGRLGRPEHSVRGENLLKNCLEN